MYIDDLKEKYMSDISNRCKLSDSECRAVLLIAQGRQKDAIIELKHGLGLQFIEAKYLMYALRDKFKDAEL